MFYKLYNHTGSKFFWGYSDSASDVRTLISKNYFDFVCLFLLTEVWDFFSSSWFVDSESWWSTSMRRLEEVLSTFEFLVSLVESNWKKRMEMILNVKDRHES